MDEGAGKEDLRKRKSENKIFKQRAKDPRDEQSTSGFKKGIRYKINLKK